MKGSTAHRTGTTVLSLAMATLGLALIAEALLVGGAVVVRLVLGVLFLAGGSGRLYLQARGHRQGRASGAGRGRP